MQRQLTPGRRIPLLLAAACLLATATARAAIAQGAALVDAEREAYLEWLQRSPLSPYAAVAQLPVGQGIRLGSDQGDVALTGVALHTIANSDGIVAMTGPEGRRALPRGRPVRLGGYAIVSGGTASRPVVTIFDSTRARGTPHWYPYDAALSFAGPLHPPDSARSRLVLSPEGVEVTAEDAGSVIVPIGGKPVRLSVMRLPDPVSGESDLEIYFRDSTNGDSTYPAGRFVSLVPAGKGNWRLDFNRSRNPFCAYSSAFACPAPWRGNAIPADVRAGEQYQPKE
jgi:hypothetical protein